MVVKKTIGASSTKSRVRLPSPQSRRDQSGEAQQGGEKDPRAHEFHVVANRRCVACAFEASNVWHGAEGQTHIRARSDEIGGAAKVVNLSHSARFEQQGRDLVAHHRHKGIESLHPAEEAGVFKDASYGSIGRFGARGHALRERTEWSINTRAAVGERCAYAERLFGRK